MNIFVLDEDPQLAAQYHVDSHVVKQLLEYAQLMSTCHRSLSSLPDTSPVYKPTHINHPSNVWIRQSKSNYDWLYSLWSHLHDEYDFRYSKWHKSFVSLSKILAKAPESLTDEGLTPVLLAMPDDCKRPCTSLSDAVEAYRMYYVKHKRYLFSWKKRNEPDWVYPLKKQLLNEE